MNREALARIAKKHRADLIILFGSRARGTARSDSDVDVCVVAPNLRGDELDLQARLSEVLGGDVDLVRFERSGTVLRFHAVFPGRLLWGTPAAFRRLRLRVLKDWQDARTLDDALTESLRRP